MSEKDIYLFMVVSDNHAGTWQGESYFPTETLNEADFVIRIERATGKSEIIKSRYGNTGIVGDSTQWNAGYAKGREDALTDVRNANLEVISAIESLVCKIQGAT